MTKSAPPMDNLFLPTPEAPTAPSPAAELLDTLSGLRGLVGVNVPMWAGSELDEGLTQLGLQRYQSAAGWHAACPVNTRMSRAAELLPEASTWWGAPDADWAMLTRLSGGTIIATGARPLMMDGLRVVGVKGADEALAGELIRMGWLDNGQGAMVMPVEFEGQRVRPRNTKRAWERVGGLKVIVESSTVNTEAVSETREGGARVYYPYQQAVMDELERVWASADPRACIMSATGTGKSVLIAGSAQRWLAMNPEHVVAILVPQQNLALQNAAHVNTDIDDEGREAWDGLPEIGILMQGHRPHSGARVIVSTFQSAKHLPETFQGRKLMVIVDEAHATSDDRAETLRSLRPARLLGLSATPAREDGLPLGRTYGALVRGVDYDMAWNLGLLVRPRYLIADPTDLAALREEFAPLDQAWQAVRKARSLEERLTERLKTMEPSSSDYAAVQTAIRRAQAAATGRISDYYSVLSGIIKPSGADYSPEQLSALMGGESVQVITNIVAEVKRLCTTTTVVSGGLTGIPGLDDEITVQGVGSGVVFMATVRQAQAVADALNEAGISAACIHAGTSAEDRAVMNAGFRDGSINVLCNVGVLVQGWDATHVQFLVMGCPTASPSRYLQIVGRGLRRHPGKTECVILDFAGNHGRLRGVESYGFGYWQAEWDRAMNAEEKGAGAGKASKTLEELVALAGQMEPAEQVDLNELVRQCSCGKRRHEGGACECGLRATDPYRCPCGDQWLGTGETQPCPSCGCPNPPTSAASMIQCECGCEREGGLVCPACGSEAVVDSAIRVNRITVNVQLSELGAKRANSKNKAEAALAKSASDIEMGGTVARAVLGMVSNSGLTRARRQSSIRALLAAVDERRLFSELSVAAVQRGIPAWVAAARWEQMTGSKPVGPADMGVPYCPDAGALLGELIRLENARKAMAKRFGQLKAAERAGQRVG